MNTIIEIPFVTAAAYPERISHRYRSAQGFTEKTYGEFGHYIRVLTAGFKHHGLHKGDHIGFSSTTGMSGYPQTSH